MSNEINFGNSNKVNVAYLDSVEAVLTSAMGWDENNNQTAESQPEATATAAAFVSEPLSDNIAESERATFESLQEEATKLGRECSMNTDDFGQYDAECVRNATT